MSSTTSFCKRTTKNKSQKTIQHESILKELNEFKLQSTKEAETIIKEYMPIKILQLTKIFNKISKENKLKILSTNNSINLNTNTSSNNPTIISSNLPLKINCGQKRTFIEMNNNSMTKTTVTDIDMDSNTNNNNTNNEITENTASVGEEKQDSNENIPQNERSDIMNISSLTALVKEEIHEFIQYLNKIKTFVNFHVPKIEDGNNFGVEVQETVKAMLDGGHSSCNSFLNTLPRYYQIRAKIECKIVKYPYLEDYKRTLGELDEKQVLALEHCFRDLRNNYWVLYDILVKNWTKIVKPKGDRCATFSMY